MNENYNDCHHQKTTRTFIYTKSKKKRNVYIYIQKSRHLTKTKTICVTFLFTKSQTLYFMRFFMKFLKLTFMYIYKNPDSLRYAIFHRNFEIGRGGHGCLDYLGCRSDCRIGTLSMKTSVFVQKREYLKIRLIVCICFVCFVDPTTSLEFLR